MKCFALTQSRTTNVVGRHVFYNNSSFDGGDPQANESDDNAIATDKFALLPGQYAMFRNATSYDKGINGVMIDIFNMPEEQLYTTDFILEYSSGDPADPWDPVPAAPSSITSRQLEDGVTRVTLIWDGNAVSQNWLKVTVKVTTRTGLDKPDVFYFGNLIGETDGVRYGPVENGNLTVTTSDADLVAGRVDPATAVPVDDTCDIDCEGYVTQADLDVVNDPQHQGQSRPLISDSIVPNFVPGIVHVHGFDNDDPEEPEENYRDGVSVSPASAHVFYNDSSFDNYTSGADAADDNAIATDKEALLPGQTVTFGNVTSYDKGLNGIMVDLWDLPADRVVGTDGGSV